MALRPKGRVSLLQSELSQRVLIQDEAARAADAVPRRRIGASSLREREVFGTPPVQQARQAIVSFEAARLGVNPVLRFALPRELLPDGPGLGPHRRVFDRDDVFERGRRGTRPALEEMQVFACALIV